jgi:hypothetical protein
LIGGGGPMCMPFMVVVGVVGRSDHEDTRPRVDPKPTLMLL